MCKVQVLLEFCRRDYEGFLQSFSLVRFREWYGDAFKESDLLTEEPGPWRCKLLGEAGEFKGWVLCNAEDVVRCDKCRLREEGALCGGCEVALCHECAMYVFAQARKGGIPWSLANDNFWDETYGLLYKYNVTWLEMTVASPCWTTMLVCYVEGDQGHLMNEVVGKQQWRTRVKGSVASFQMPWEDIITDLKRNIGDAALEDIPRSAATVKYMMCVHLKVGIIDFTKKS